MLSNINFKIKLVFCYFLQEKCHQYWPEERSARYQYFVVDPVAQYNMPLYILREFKVTDARVRRLFCCILLLFLTLYIKTVNINIQ